MDCQMQCISLQYAEISSDRIFIFIFFSWKSFLTSNIKLHYFHIFNVCSYKNVIMDNLKFIGFQKYVTYLDAQ